MNTPKYVTGSRLREVSRHRAAIVAFLVENWQSLGSLALRQSIELQALELLYVSAHKQAFGEEPRLLPTCRADQYAFLVEAEHQPLPVPFSQAAA